MRIENIIREIAPVTYKRLKNMGKKKIELGDRPEKLMKANSYKRCGRRIRQINWE